MQTTHPQQPDQLLNLNERHTKHNFLWDLILERV